MGAVIGLGLGLGIVLVWSAFVVPRTVRSQPRPSDVRFSRMLAEAGLGSVSPRSFLFLCLVLAFSAALLLQLAANTPPVSFAFGVIAGWIPVAIVRSRARARRREFAEVWPEAVDHLASGVRAGLSLPEAVSGLSVRGPEPLRAAFAQFAVDYQVTGRFSECLDRLKEHLADPVGDRVVEGLRVAREVGGGELGRLLRNLSGYLRDDARTRAELEARQSWTVNGARLAVAAPWLVLLMMAFQTELIRRYASPGGAVVLLVGASLCVLAYTLMMRIGRLPAERRILS